MLLYLVRHGEARKTEVDPQRGLTDKGKEDVTKVAARAGKLAIPLDQIFHSPKPRAQQTAKILAEHLKPEKGIDQADNLLPMDDPSLWALRILGMGENIMLVGHLPYMARLAGLLLCGDKDKMCVDFKAGGIVCLKRSDEGRWTVAWTMMPDML
jgi:phosphohistidine phosphatase